MYITGDFNARLGNIKFLKEEHERNFNNDFEHNISYEDHIGLYGHGKLNEAGEEMINFLIMNSLFACITAFKHKASHTATWSGVNKNTHNGATNRYYKQIDYILCKTRSKRNLINARSYGGTYVQSNHKLVTVQLKLDIKYMLFKNKVNSQTKKLCVEKLVNKDGNSFDTYQK